MKKQTLSKIILFILIAGIFYVACWYGASFFIKQQISQQQSKIYQNKVQLDFSTVENSGFLAKFYFVVNKVNITLFDKYKSDATVSLNSLTFALDPINLSVMITLPRNIEFKDSQNNLLFHFVKPNDIKINLTFKEIFAFIINKQDSMLNLISNIEFETSKMTVKNMNTHKVTYYSSGMNFSYYINSKDYTKYIKIKELGEYNSASYKVVIFLNSSFSVKQKENIYYYNIDKSQLQIGKLDAVISGNISQENSQLNSMNLLANFKNAVSIPYIAKFLFNELGVKDLKFFAANKNIENIYSDLIEVLGYRNNSESLKVKIYKKDKDSQLQFNNKNLQEIINLVVVDNVFKRINKLLTR